jgi:hypothetical protein
VTPEFKYEHFALYEGRYRNPHFSLDFFFGLSKGGDIVNISCLTEILNILCSF